MNVVVTGGSGRLGQLVIRQLLHDGLQVLSIDRVPSPVKLCPSWTVDLRKSGDLYEALAGVEGVIHLGAYQAPGMAPDSETFVNNVSATYNVLKAASDLGVKRVVVASSSAAFGFLYAKKFRPPDYLPLDETHPSKPHDPYGLSKLVGEEVANAFAATHRLAVASLRFPGINFDPNYKIFAAKWRDPGARAASFWAYVDARDAAAACRLALEADFMGHEVFIVAAPRSAIDEPTDKLLRRYLPGVKKAKPELVGNWSGLDSTKAHLILKFRAEYSWEGG